MAGYFLHCCASSVPSRGDRVEWWKELRGKNWVLSSLAQSWGVYIEFALPNWEGGKVCTDHGLCTLGWCTGGKPYSEIGNWWCIYTVVFLSKKGIILFPLFCSFWFPLLYFHYGCLSSEIYPCSVFMLWLCPFILDFALLFFVAVMLSLCSGKCCYFDFMFFVLLLFWSLCLSYGDYVSDLWSFWSLIWLLIFWLSFYWFGYWFGYFSLVYLLIFLLIFFIYLWSFIILLISLLVLWTNYWSLISFTDFWSLFIDFFTDLWSVYWSLICLLIFDLFTDLWPFYWFLIYLLIFDLFTDLWSFYWSSFDLFITFYLFVFVSFFLSLS